MPRLYQERWANLTEPFKTLGDHDLERMMNAACDFILDIHSQAEPRWLSFLGRSGTGKTMLAKAIMQFIHDVSLQFMHPGTGATMTHLIYSAKWPRMVGEMKQGDFDTVDLLCEKEIKWDGSKGNTYAFALIDDIGQPEDSGKSYLLASLGRIADERMGSWTIWTSNLKLSQIADTIDPRVASRMIRGDNVVIETTCMDYNLR